MFSQKNPYFSSTDKRVLIVAGHYGSGKTEFSVSLAMHLAKLNKDTGKKLALVDLDIANPYFRSRERRELLERNGIQVYADVYNSEITAELPALSAEIRKPLEDESTFVIVDVGGNDTGARVLSQFKRYYTGDHLFLTVINANRPETRDLEGAIFHLESIKYETGMAVDGIINNCHLLMETTAETVKKGHRLCEEVSKTLNIPVFCDCYPEPLVKREELEGLSEHLMPIGMFMRASWLDK